MAVLAVEFPPPPGGVDGGRVDAGVDPDRCQRQSQDKTDCPVTISSKGVGAEQFELREEASALPEAISA